MKKLLGQTLVEVLVAIVIFGIILVLFVSSIANLSNSMVNSRIKSQAVQYAREGIEICYNLSLDWEKFKEYGEGTFHPVIKNGVFILTEDEQVLAGKFSRQLVIEKAWRDSNNGNLDPEGDGPNSVQDGETRKVTSTVNWNSLGKDESVELVIFLSNLESVE